MARHGSHREAAYHGACKYDSFSLEAVIKGNDEVIALLNDVLCAELTGINQYFAHSMICANWRYKRLAEYSRRESIEEMKHAQEVIERIRSLDGIPNMEKYMRINVGRTVPEEHQYDLTLEKDAVAVALQAGQPLIALAVIFR